MSRESNLEVVRQRFGEHPILDEADADLAAIYSADVVLHGPAEQFVGLDGIKQAAEATRSAFSDIEFRIAEMTADENDKVVTKIVGRSRHTGPFQGAQPSGKWVQVNGIVISRLQEGQIVEEWRNMTWSPAAAPADEA
ncbi:MAG TPA: ester cyclase [Dehalococcoidia bacterium]|nr:ester cyclase [Dehalococcoidia bacterium]